MLSTEFVRPDVFLGALALAGVLVALLVVPLMGTSAAVGRYLHPKVLDMPPWPEG